MIAATLKQYAPNTEICADNATPVSISQPDKPGPAAVANTMNETMTERPLPKQCGWGRSEALGRVQRTDTVYFFLS